MLNRLFIIICVLNIILSTNQAKIPLGEFLSDIFDTYCGPEHVCVKHHQCKDGKVNRDGSKIVHPRFGEENQVTSSMYANCTHYLEKCCNLSKRNLNAMVFVPPQLKHSLTCGYRNERGIALRIMDDDKTTAEFAEFPWMMAILKNNTYLCGGGLISESVVITVAHYVHKEPPYSLLARAGEYDTQTILEPLTHEDRIVTRIIVHEKYRDQDFNLFYDIALLFLDRKFAMKPNIQPICLPDANTNFDHEHCIVTGWGKDKFGHEGQKQVILKKIEIPVIPHEQCEIMLRATSALGRFFNLHETFICAGGQEGRDACEGDGGSPLVCPIPGQPGRYQLAGLVAWGVECGLRDVPGAYVNIVLLREWINEKLVQGGFDIDLLVNPKEIPEETISPNIKPTAAIISNITEERTYDNGCAANEVCVRSFQCINGKVNRDGRKIIHVRMRDDQIISKCDHFMDRCCDKEDFKKVQKTTETTLDLDESEGCGFRKDLLEPPKSVNLIGATLTSYAEFPWMVAILKDKKFVCAGALLSDSVVLTLASCVFKYEPRQLEVRAGEWDTKSTKEPLPHEDRRGIKIIEHWNFVLESNSNHNIALFILQRPFELKTHINPICLPKFAENNFKNTECLLTGWGQFNEVESEQFNILKYSTWKITENAPCNETADGSQSHCMVMKFDAVDNKKDACQHMDTGSPLVCKVPNLSNRYQLAGIMLECNSDEGQASFTSVPFFNKWLSDKITGWFNGSLQLDIRSISKFL